MMKSFMFKMATWYLYPSDPELPEVCEGNDSMSY